MSNQALVLVTGAVGRIGGVGREVVEIIRRRGLPVRALVKSEDERAVSFRATGAEVIVGDVTWARTSPASWRAADECTLERTRRFFGEL
jgi:nucleoside-diphosphate-sugar epimerase